MPKFLWIAAALIALPLAACNVGDAGTVHDTAADSDSPAGEGAAGTPAGAPETNSGDVAAETPVPTAAPVAPAFTRPYPGSRVVSEVRSPTQADGLITFQTDADPGTVVAYYRERAEEAGLTARADITMGDTRQFGADSREGSELSVSITPQDQLSTVTVTWEGVAG
jgi:hypothetical protein